MGYTHMHTNDTDMLNMRICRICTREYSDKIAPIVYGRHELPEAANPAACRPRTPPGHPDGRLRAGWPRLQLTPRPQQRLPRAGW